MLSMGRRVKFPRMVGVGRSDAPRAVVEARSRAVPASPAALWAVVSRPDAALLLPGAALVVPVPGGALSVVVVLGGPGAGVRVQEQLAGPAPMSLQTIDHTLGWSSTVRVEPRRGGARVHLEQSGQAPRLSARALHLQFELVAAPWLDTVDRVATGFADFPQQRPDLVAAAAGALPSETATLRVGRTLAASPAEVWQQLLQPDDGRQFWTGDGPLAVGDWLYTLVGEGPILGYVREVTAAVPGQRLTLRSVAGVHHESRNDWWLQETPAGTLVTLNHECATSHVGLPPVVDLALDGLQERLSKR
jgi:hypothetical protein